jgi:hypothetical protein
MSEEIHKASHSASMIGSIMQTRPTKLLMWQLINEEREDYSIIGRYYIIVHITRNIKLK